MSAPLANVRAVLFDMDGVLIDSEPRYLKIVEDFMRANGREPDREKLIASVGASHKDTWRIFAEVWGGGVDIDWLKAHFARSGAGRISFAGIEFPGMRETLRALHESGLRLYIASASSQSTIERMMRETDIEGFIDGAVSGETVKRSKPYPDVYLQAIALSGCKAEECIAVEDSIYGIESAHRAHLRVVGVRNELDPTARAHADYALESVADLRALLLGEH